MKLIISTIVGFFVLFLLGWLLYGMLFMNYFENSYSQIARSMESFRWWSLIAANFTQALLISIIYSKFFKTGDSPFNQGFTCGLWLGFLMTIPYIFYMYASYRIPDGIALLVDGMISGFMTLATTIIIALIQGTSAPVKETVTA